MKRILCLMFGHDYTGVLSVNPKYKIYVCPRCGKTIKLEKIGG